MLAKSFADLDVLSTPEPQTTSTEAAKLPIKIVTHYYPDTDAMASIWATIRFLAQKQGRECTPAFVRAGESLDPADCEGYEVITVDTGHGELDQHGKDRGKKTSSFELFCKKYGLCDDPGMKPIIELTVLSDNVQYSRLSPTSIHYLLKGLPFYYRDKVSKEVDWDAVINEACKIFDIIYDQTVQQWKSEQDFKKLGRVVHLKNGIKLGLILHHPRLRQAAYDAGCDVVLWTQDLKGEKKGKYYVGIQAHELADTKLTFESVMVGIRLAEAGKRGVNTQGIDLRAWGQTKEAFGGWFLHDSLRFISCGTRGHELEPDECTKLSEREIVDIVRTRLERERFRAR